MKCRLLVRFKCPPSNPLQSRSLCRTSIICLVGCDGSGKSTLAKFVVEELRQRGLAPVLVWSRYNHIFSKPLLALARFLGYSPREVHDETTFGYHEFYRAWWLKWLFIVLQVIDVNIAIRMQINAAKKNGDVLVFERSPWDTLADVMLDTRYEGLGQTCWGRWIISSMLGRSDVYWISRDYDAILQTRPELRHDRSLKRKITIYERLAVQYSWVKINNMQSLEKMEQRLVEKLINLTYKQRDEEN